MKYILLLLLICAGCSLPAPNAPHIDRQALAVSLGIERVLHAFNSVPDPHLPVILAICKVESGFDPLAKSATGDMGIMQVNRHWHPEIVKKWSNPQDNVKIGYSIFLDCMSRSETLNGALGRYNGDRSGRYARKVLTEYANVIKSMRGDI